MMIRTALACRVLAVSLTAAAATPTVPASAMPDETIGTWGRDAEACTRPESRGRIRVERRSIQFFHATCTFDRIRIVADGIFDGRGTCVEVKGGGRYAGGAALMGLDDTMTVRFRGSQTSHSYQRCARALPVR